MKYLSKLNLVLLIEIVSLFVNAPAIAWTRFYEKGENSRGYSVQQTTDGGYVVAGSTYLGATDVYLIKTDSLGDTLWTGTYGGSEGRSVQQTTDGGYIVAGLAWSDSTGEDVYLIKTDSLGDTLWTRTYGDSTDDWGYSVQQTTDGGYIVAGCIISLNAGYAYVYLIKTDSLGDTLWTRTYGDTSSNGANSVQQTSDGGYIVAGFTDSRGAGSLDFYLIKTDSLGDTLWTRTYGGTYVDLGYSVRQTTDGGYIVTGYTAIGGWNRKVYLIKTNSLGDTLWTRTYGTLGREDYGYSVQQTTDGGYIVAGWTKGNGIDNSLVCLIKVNFDGSGGIEEEIIPNLLSLSPADPNPFTTKTTVSYELTNATNVNVSIYNLLGQEVKKLYSRNQSSGIHSVTWDGSGTSGKLPTGIYLLKIKAGNQEASLKLTFIR